MGDVYFEYACGLEGGATEQATGDVAAHDCLGRPGLVEA
jgi:hypothetical protein